ncbi:hypothetical protein HWV62_23002 [Athelia sp. TMB]|nr:hypothetical protein HWV62_23002 [Athelia sp. TMB]
MINIFALSSLALAILRVVVPVSAHGYVSLPPSRQALCRDNLVPDCGDVRWEPQSVEAPKGSFACNGDGPRFAELNNEALWKDHFSPVAPSAGPLSFTWMLTAPHRTTNWEYFMLTEGTPLLASFDDGGSMPPTTVVHQVSLKGFTGRQTVLARWNIYDTPQAFYSCVDLYLDPEEYSATAVATPAATQLPIGIPAMAALGVGSARTNDSSSANTSPSVNMPLQNVFVMDKARRFD